MTWKLSIVIPCYNEENRILPLLKSIETQSVKPEAIFVDGGSTDNTVKIIRSFMERNKNIRLLFEKENRSPANARNVGIQAATGNLLLLLNVDTVFENNYTKKVIGVFRKNPNADVIYLNVDQNIPEDIGVFQKAVIFRDGHATTSNSKPYRIAKTELQKKILYNPKLGFGEDRWVEKHGFSKAKFKAIHVEDRIHLTCLSYPTFRGFFSRGLWYGRTLPTYLKRERETALMTYYLMSIISIPLMLIFWASPALLFFFILFLALPFFYGVYKAIEVLKEGCCSTALLFVPFLEVIQFMCTGIGFYQYLSGNRTLGR